MIKLAVLGSTGSVGTQTLEVVRAFREEIDVCALVARRASEKLLDQAKEFKPEVVVIQEEPQKSWVSELPKETTLLKGEEGLEEAIKLADRVMNAISGVHGIKPAFYTLKMGKLLLASNKESIVCLPEEVSENRERIIPVDSEHNALFQLLKMVPREEIKYLYLTASGGPFRNSSLEEMKRASPQEALKHPRWNMGAKITVDSATLMNKGFEMIEAKHLFGFDLSKIKIVVHPQSVVHGLLELVDGTFLMHASDTDMRVPITHALFFPQRKKSPFKRSPITSLSPMDFEPLDTERFKAPEVARWAGEMGGAYLPVLVGADEEAVNLFLEGKIGFLDIVDLVEEVLSSVNFPDPKSIDEVIEAVEWAREKVREIAKIRMY